MEDNTSPGNQQLVISNPQQLAGLLNKNTARETRAMVRANPAGALAVLVQMQRDGVGSPRGRGFLFEEILGEVARPQEARDLVDQHLTRTAVAELLVQRAGLPSVAAEVLGRETIIAALLLDISTYTPPTPPLDSTSTEGSSKSEQKREERQWAQQHVFRAEHVAMTLYTWAPGLRDRADWKEILRYEVDNYPLRDYLITAVYYLNDRRAPKRILSSEWSGVGLSPRKARERLRFMREKNSFPEMDPRTMLEASRQLLERQDEVKSALAKAARDAAQGIDF